MLFNQTIVLFYNKFYDMKSFCNVCIVCFFQLSNCILLKNNKFEFYYINESPVSGKYGQVIQQTKKDRC